MARLNLNNNAKFKTLVQVLKLPRPYVRGLLETLWDVADEDGNPLFKSPMHIEAAAEWPGEPGVLFLALRDLRFIDPPSGMDETEVKRTCFEDPFQWSIHDYFDHAPGYVYHRKQREGERKREKFCQFCNGSFRNSDPRARFCSSGCRLKFHRTEQKSGDISSKSTIETERNGSETESSVSETEVKRTETERNASPAPAPAPAQLLKKKEAAARPADKPPVRLPKSSPQSVGSEVDPDSNRSIVKLDDNGNPLPERKNKIPKLPKESKTPDPEKAGHRETVDYFAKEWQKVHGSKFAWVDRHFKAIQRLLNAVGRNVGKAKKVIDAFLADETEYVAVTRVHDPQVLDPNKYLAAAAGEPRPPLRLSLFRDMQDLFPNMTEADVQGMIDRGEMVDDTAGVSGG